MVVDVVEAVGTILSKLDKTVVTNEVKIMDVTMFPVTLATLNLCADLYNWWKRFSMK